MDTIPFYISNLGPAIVRRVSSEDGTFNIEAGQTFRLRARARDSSTILLDKPMTTDVGADTVTYQPVASDAIFKTEGIYRAWVHYVNALQDSEEFEVIVLEHAPGVSTRIGAVYRACRALEPVAWDALHSYPDYGDAELQRVIDLAKLRVLGSAVPASNEASLDPRVVDYVAKKVLVDNVLHAAISFWTNQFMSQTARGNSEEVVTYPDRIRTTENAIERYRGDLALQLGEVESLTGATSSYDAPMIDVGGPLLTPGLDEFPALPVTTQTYWRRPR
jgi:hypothetical protein